MRRASAQFDRRALANQALRAAATARATATLDQHRPICIYGLAEALGVTVRFNNINMEGMYHRCARPRIHLSALRPLPRRAYNCAHELGHHVFGHGSSIDELREDASVHPWDDPKEFLADAFAGVTLMPIIGLRRAFAVRGWTPQNASAPQLFSIACDFGVGYRTLVTHLVASVHLISRARAAALQRLTPKVLRTAVLGHEAAVPLLVADRYCMARTLDAEVSTLLLLPPGTQIAGPSLAYERDLPNGRLFRAAQPGIVQARACDGAWTTFIRVARKAYVGLAAYRHLEEDARDEQV